MTVGVIKALDDDDTARKLEQVKLSEEQKFRPFIYPCKVYSMAPPQISAMEIASFGGTAWRHPNGLWVFLTDALGRPVHDFKPKVSVTVYQPKTPLTKSKHAPKKFLWGTTK